MTQPGALHMGREGGDIVPRTWPCPAEQAGAVQESQRATRQGLGNMVWSWHEEENREYEGDKKLFP